MKEEEDLNIRNYDLKDLLFLFKLPTHYTKDDLFAVKKLLAKNHPDKSASLSVERFHFLKEAYDILNNLLEKPRGHQEEIGDNKEVLDNFFREEKIDNFHVWFNKHFEDIKGEEDTSNGYEDWLRGKESKQNKKQTSSSSLINGFFLDAAEDHSYDSDMFGSLTYQDLYKAHTAQPMADVTHEAENPFRNADELKRYRDRQDITPLTEEESMLILNSDQYQEREQALQRKYNLMKQGEHFAQLNNDFLKRLI